MTWFELFQIRELPAHPRERESMKRQQSVEVRKEQDLIHMLQTMALETFS